MIDCIAYEMPQRVFQSLEDRPVQFDVPTLDNQIDFFVFSLSQVANHPFQPRHASENGSMRTR